MIICCQRLSVNAVIHRFSNFRKPRYIKKKKLTCSVKSNKLNYSDLNIFRSINCD